MSDGCATGSGCTQERVLNSRDKASDTASCVALIAPSDLIKPGVLINMSGVKMALSATT